MIAPSEPPANRGNQRSKVPSVAAFGPPRRRPAVVGRCRDLSPGVRVPVGYFTIMAVTMPNMPSAFSAWGRMWQCQAHTPGVAARMRTL